MHKISLLFSMTLAMIISACSDSNDSDAGLSYHYDTSLTYDETVLELDSISGCILDSAEIDRIYKLDTLYIENQKFWFPSQVHSLQSNIKSIGVHAFGDTLKLELIEKSKTVQADFYCPVWVYGSLSGNLQGKFVSTFTGVYALSNR